MITFNEITRFILEWSNQNSKQLREVTEELRKIEGADAGMFTREQMRWGDWRRYHYLKGVKTQRLEVQGHLSELEAMCKAHGPLCIPDEKIKERENLSRNLSEAIAQKSALLNSLDEKCQATERRWALIAHEIPTESDILDRAARRDEIVHQIEEGENELKHLEGRLQLLRSSKGPKPGGLARIDEIHSLLRQIIVDVPTVDELRDESLDDAVELVCRDLPPGWIACLKMEKDSAWVELSDPQGKDVDVDSHDDLPGVLIDALEIAKKQPEVD